MSLAAFRGNRLASLPLFGLLADSAKAKCSRRCKIRELKTALRRVFVPMKAGGGRRTGNLVDHHCICGRNSTLCKLILLDYEKNRAAACSFRQNLFGHSIYFCACIFVSGAVKEKYH